MMKNRITALFLCVVMALTLTVPMTLITCAAEINKDNIADVTLTEDFWGPVNKDDGESTEGPADDSTGDTTGEKTEDNTTGETTEPGKDQEEPAAVDFPDVKPEDWFYSDVRTLAGMGIVNGYNDGTFGPQGNVTRAEFIKLIVALKIKLGGTLAETEEVVFEDVAADAWYADYVTTALTLGLINKEEYGAVFNPNEPVTRREVAKIAVRALGGETGKYKTPYVDADDENITALYAMCIMQGNVNPETAERYFYPDTQITRAETSAVILRVYKYSLDAEKYMNDFKSVNVVKELEVLSAPVTASEFYNEFTNAWENSQAFLIYEYDYALGNDNIRKIKEECFEAFRVLTEHNPEYATYMALNMEIQSDNRKSTIKLSFSSSCEEYTYEELCTNSVEASGISKDIITEITQGYTTDIEKADAIHDYLCENIEYDDSFASGSYTAYGALTTGRAVCQGYSAAFNTLCKTAGVKALAVANNNHMWNVVLSDGQMYHYDATFDDAGVGISDKYKGIPQSEFISDDDHSDYVLPDTKYFK